MLGKGLIGVLVVAVAATGIAVAEDGGGASRPEPFKPLAQHEVAAPSKAAGGQASKLTGFSKVKYFVSNTANVDPDSEITGSLKCPRRSAAISGFFQDNKSRVVLDYSSVGGTVRKWDFGVFNFNDGVTAKARVGVVCIK
jgi:hypothetical protein